MVLGTGFLLLVSLVLTAILSALGDSLSQAFPGAGVVWQIVNQLVSFGVIILLFAMIFRLLPDAQIAWRDVWIGAILTAALFSLGKFLLGWYLGREGVTSGFGAAGSLVVVLLWVYYSSLILLFGAEFTRVYAEQFGSGMKPAANAVPLTPEARARQGMPTKDQLQEAAHDQRH
jgi:membrane protein